LVRLAAEILGAFALVFVAAGADAAAQVSGGEVSDAARAVAPALIVAAMIYAIGDVSGAHLNPGVTLAFTLRRLFSPALVPVYWVGQLGGAILGAAAVEALFGGAVAASVSRPHVFLEHGSVPSTIAIEALLTGLLVMVVLGTAERHRVVGPNAAIAVGATIACCGLIAVPIEGASMNPARSIGPALITGELKDVWPYVVGPALGSLAAALASHVLHGRSERDAASREAAQGERGVR
jgi:aquaporin Z